MNKIDLVKIDSTGTGVTHIKVLIDEKDVGMLYLNADIVTGKQIGRAHV